MHCYVAPSLPSSCFLGHVTGIIFCLYNFCYITICIVGLLIIFNKKTPEKTVDISSHCWKTQEIEHSSHRTQFISSKQIAKRCRITKCTHNLVQVTESCFTNQYSKSKIRSRISLKKWYQDATSVFYGHLLKDLTPKTVDSLSYCSNTGSVPINFYLPAGVETQFLDDEHTIRLYSANISKIFSKTSITIHSQLSKKFHFVSLRVFSKPIRRRASRSSERRRSKPSTKTFRTNTKKNF